MLMTKPQKVVLALVQSLKAVRYGQLFALMKSFGPPSPGQMDAMLRQLCCAGMLVRDQEIIWASGADPPDGAHFEAIDVMLEITGGDVLACAAGRAPVLLRFISGGEQSRAFFVTSGRAPALDLPLSLLPGQRAIVMLPENDSALRSALPPSHFAAIADANGRYHFFRCGK